MACAVRKAGIKPFRPLHTPAYEFVFLARQYSFTLLLPSLRSRIAFFGSRVAIRDFRASSSQARVPFLGKRNVVDRLEISWHRRQSS